MHATPRSKLPNVIQAILNGVVAEQFHGRTTLPPLQLIVRQDTKRTDSHMHGADRDVVASSNDADTDEYVIFIWSPFKLFVDSIEVFSTNEYYDRYTWIPHPNGKVDQLPALVALVGKKVLDVHLDGECGVS